MVFGLLINLNNFVKFCLNYNFAARVSETKNF